MPRNVRNFWVEAEVDGQDTEIAFGPRAKDGGFRLTVYMRDRGDIITALKVTGEALSDGTLRLWMEPNSTKVEETLPHEYTISTLRDADGKRRTP